MQTQPSELQLEAHDVLGIKYIMYSLFSSATLSSLASIALPFFFSLFSPSVKQLHAHWKTGADALISFHNSLNILKIYARNKDGERCVCARVSYWGETGLSFVNGPKPNCAKQSVRLIQRPAARTNTGASTLLQHKLPALSFPKNNLFCQVGCGIQLSSPLPLRRKGACWIHDLLFCFASIDIHA